jgi:predicted HTH transcriptional regulator
MWIPKSENDLKLALSEGTLSETHYLDAKATTGAANSDRRETAKDLASFALDGGALIIGVSEDKAAQEFSLSPINLAGLSEKIEQIATSRIDPPLHIRVTELPSAEGEGIGYLFVEVPPSPLAPHMVDNVYYARGDKTTRKPRTPK